MLAVAVGYDHGQLSVPEERSCLFIRVEGKIPKYLNGASDGKSWIRVG